MMDSIYQVLESKKNVVKNLRKMAKFGDYKNSKSNNG